MSPKYIYRFLSPATLLGEGRSIAISVKQHSIIAATMSVVSP